METELKTHILSDSRPPRVPKSHAELHLSVGRYELVRRLAYGGMAAVYLGRALGKAGFEKTVAVKVIHPHLAAEQQFVEMFLDEARIVAGIQHPHVVQILDLGQDGELYYMVMEFVEGETLSALISSLAPQRLPLSVALQIIADAVSGLVAAHDLQSPDGELYNIVHRDISPQNLLINLLGWVKISDFGIMKVAGADRNTRAGELRGKLAYMSPEQARGHDIDHRTDLFSLGVIFWELLTGRRLFVGENDAATLENVLACEIPRLESMTLATRNQQPTEFWVKLQSVLDRALARERCDRYANAPEMLSDVQALLRMCIKGGDEDEPREQLAAFMKEHFGARAAYARAALRETTPVDDLGGADFDATEPSELKFERQAGRSDLWAIPPVEPSSHSKLSTIAELHPRTKSSPGSNSKSILDHWLFRSIVVSALIVLFGSVVVLISLRWQDSPLTSVRDRYAQSLPSTSLASSGTAGANSDILPIMTTAEHEGGLLNIARPDEKHSEVSILIAPFKEDDGETVRWEFTGSPPDASIYIDGKLYSQLTPTGVVMKKSKDLHHVVIKKEGMRPIEYRLFPRADQNIFYQLFPVERGKNSGKNKVEPNVRVSELSGRNSDTLKDGPKFMPMPKFESEKLKSNQ